MGLKDLFKKQEKVVEEVKEDVKEVVEEVKETIKPIASFKGGEEVSDKIKPIASFKGGEELKDEAERIKEEAQAAVAGVKDKVKELEDVAARVIRGEFGNGEERKAALEKAGFNYDEVQAKVNEVLSGVKTTATNTLKSVEEIAKEVIRGDWGNGEERRAALEKAGYKFEEIQAKVNELLK